MNIPETVGELRLENNELYTNSPLARVSIKSFDMCSVCGVNQILMYHKVPPTNLAHPA